MNFKILLIMLLVAGSNAYCMRTVYEYSPQAREEYKKEMRYIALSKADELVKLIIEQVGGELLISRCQMLDIWLKVQRTELPSEIEILHAVRIACFSLLRNQRLETEKRNECIVSICRMMEKTEFAGSLKGDLLVLAAFLGAGTLVQWLLHDGVDIESEMYPCHMLPESGNRPTALYWAHFTKNDSIARLLLACQARNPREMATR